MWKDVLLNREERRKAEYVRSRYEKKKKMLTFVFRVTKLSYRYSNSSYILLLHYIVWKQLFQMAVNPKSHNFLSSRQVRKRNSSWKKSIKIYRKKVMSWRRSMFNYVKPNIFLFFSDVQSEIRENNLKEQLVSSTLPKFLPY